MYYYSKITVWVSTKRKSFKYYPATKKKKQFEGTQ